MFELSFEELEEQEYKMKEIKRSIYQAANLYIINEMLQKYAWGLQEKRLVYKGKDSFGVFYNAITGWEYDLSRSIFDRTQSDLISILKGRGSFKISDKLTAQMCFVSQIEEGIFKGEELLEVKGLQESSWLEYYTHKTLISLLNNYFAPDLLAQYNNLEKETLLNVHFGEDVYDRHAGKLEDMQELISYVQGFNAIRKNKESFLFFKKIEGNIVSIQNAYKRSCRKKEPIAVTIVGLVRLWEQLQAALKSELEDGQRKGLKGIKTEIDQKIRLQGRSEPTGKHMKQLKKFIQGL